MHELMDKARRMYPMLFNVPRFQVLHLGVIPYFSRVKNTSWLPRRNDIKALQPDDSFLSRIHIHESRIRIHSPCSSSTSLLHSASWLLSLPLPPTTRQMKVSTHFRSSLSSTDDVSYAVVDACNGHNPYGVGHSCAWGGSQGSKWALPSFLASQSINCGGLQQLARPTAAVFSSASLTKSCDRIVVTHDVG